MIPRERFTDNYFYNKLSNKTQMIKNGKNNIFTNRMRHTQMVSDTCIEIVNKLGLCRYVNVERLIASAKFHDIGHTPFGHAGEDIINEIFLSFDKLHYSEKNPGLFKHNVNSIRLLSMVYNFDEDDYPLMDGILKHGSVFPKNYNFLPFRDSNIIKMNYIFRKIGFDKSAFLKHFNSALVKSQCPNRSDKVIMGRKICHSCASGTICLYPHGRYACDDYVISSYLSYPYPLTIEGTVLYWADEIACFSSDLLDLFLFVYNYEHDIKNFIPFSNLNSLVHRLQALHPNNRLVSYLFSYLNLSYEAKSSENATALLKNIVRNIYCELINHLVTSITPVDNDMHIYIRENKCSPLINLDSDTIFIYKEVKKTIYKDIHNIRYIHDTNEAGKEMIESLVKYYSNHFNNFIDDYKRYNKTSISYDVINELVTGAFNLLYGHTNEVPYSFKDKFVKLIKKRKIRVNYKSLANIYLFKPAFIDADNKNEVRLINLFRREICYFVASLDEKEIFELTHVLHKLNLKYQLPTLV